MSEQHWESVHAGKAQDDVSWWQPRDDVWVDLVERTGVPRTARILDVGSGSSTLVDALLVREYRDVTLVDVSGTALVRTLERLALSFDDVAARVRTLVADATTLALDPPVDVWFDRAVFHFLTDPDDRAAYSRALHASLARRGYAIVAAFAPDGPETCSGLPVQRYDADGLIQALGAVAWPCLVEERRVHVTPWGAEQPFTVIELRRP